MMKNINKIKQKKFKRKYQIFANELAGISLDNWKSDMISDMKNGNGFSRLDELIQSINGRGIQL
jgi:hypothetical protein